MALANRFIAGIAASSCSRSASSSVASARSSVCSRALPSWVVHSSASGVNRRQAARPSCGSGVRSSNPARASCLTRVLTELEAMPSSRRLRGRADGRADAAARLRLGDVEACARRGCDSRPRPIRDRTRASSEEDRRRLATGKDQWQWTCLSVTDISRKPSAVSRQPPPSAVSRRVVFASNLRDEHSATTRLIADS